MSRRLSVYHFNIFGLWATPGRNGRCAQELLRLAAKLRPSVRFIDFVGDLRLVEDSGGRARLLCGSARFMEMSKTGYRSHAKWPKSWRPCQSTPRIGFDLDAYGTRASITEEKSAKGQEVRRRRPSVRPGRETSTREPLRNASYLNFTK